MLHKARYVNGFILATQALNFLSLSMGKELELVTDGVEYNHATGFTFCVALQPTRFYFSFE